MARETSSETSEWDRQPADPDMQRDLKYELVDWMAVEASQNGRDYTMFLPEEEEMLREDEFIVVDDDTVCDLVDRI